MCGIYDIVIVMEEGLVVRFTGDLLRHESALNTARWALGVTATRLGLKMDVIAEPPRPEDQISETWVHDERGLTEDDFRRVLNFDTSISKTAVSRAWYGACRQVRGSVIYVPIPADPYRRLAFLPRAALEYTLEMYESGNIPLKGHVGPIIADVFRKVLAHTTSPESLESE